MFNAATTCETKENKSVYWEDNKREPFQEEPSPLKQALLQPFKSESVSTEAKRQHGRKRRGAAVERERNTKLSTVGSDGAPL